MYQIAVCDDDRADLSRTVRLTRRILDEAGVPCRVDSYRDGRLLLSEIQRGRSFDLLLLDVRMAGLDGMALAAELKGRPARPDVVFISVDRDMALQGYHVDARRYLAKPVEPERLREALLFCYGEAGRRAARRDDLLLPTASGEVRVSVRDIRYAETWERAARISTPPGSWRPACGWGSWPGYCRSSSSTATGRSWSTWTTCAGWARGSWNCGAAASCR